MRQALSVASECVPLVKTGGLADVTGALPGAMAGAGWALRTLLPGYPAVMAAAAKFRTVWKDGDLFGGAARVLAGRAGDLDLMILDAPHLYDRPGSIYLDPDGADWPDNPERFAALCWAGARIAMGEAGGWQPELVHVHDWQGALVPTYLAAAGAGVPSLLTVHNIAFHGLAAPGKLAALRLPEERFTPEGFEFWGRISALKAGLVDATRISTVSPTYAQELTDAAFGMGFEGVIAARRRDLSGILNGIDPGIWDPAQDPLIAAPYAAPKGKAPSRAALLREFGIADTPGPLAIVVSRLTGQKGLDLLLAALPGFLDRGGGLALLGSGERGLEGAFRDLSNREARVGVHIGYDEALSHRMFAGGDAVLVPSRFEPCGLTQLYGLRYGAVPVVARTGGLADTVIDANDAALRAGVATGIAVEPGRADALARGLDRLCALHADRRTWTRIQRNGMRHPVGWDSAAAAYAALYAELSG